jgi:exopolysaccharide production protein ExoZ
VTSAVTATDTAPADSSGHHYAALDGLRGVAVLLVFCVHAAGNSAFVVLGANFEQTRFALLTTAFDRVLFWLYLSHHGVFLFFVLSGFLIGRMWWPRPAMRYKTFAWRRTLRIYPAFLLAFAGSLVFAYASGTWPPPDAPRLIANLLFLNGAPAGNVEAFNIVTWSLFYEMTFYLAFPAFALLALAIGTRTAWWLWVAGIALPVVAAQLGANPLVLCWSLLLMGVAFAMHEPRIRAFAARVPTAAVVLAYFAVTSFALFDWLPAIPTILAFGVATVLVIAKSLERGNVVSWLLTRPLLRALGRISYSFYLVHWMLVVLVARVVSTHMQELGGIAATLAIFGGGFVASTAAAAALWWLAERPYFAWIRRSRQ